MEEYDNNSIESISIINSNDDEIINDNSVNKESSDKQSTDKQSTDKQSSDKQLNNIESTNNQTVSQHSNENSDNQINSNNNNNNQINSNNNNNNQTNSNNNQQSEIESIGNLLSEDKWVLKLNWDFREEFFKLLNKFTKLLISNKEVLVNEKRSILKNKTDLIKLLTRAPFILEEESNSYEIYINIDNNFKNQIINNLIKNENFIYHKNKIDTNLKTKLIEENNYLINKLINLPFEYSANYVNYVNLIDDDEESKCKDNEMEHNLELSNLQNETTNLKEEINQLKRKLNDEILENKKFKDHLNETNSIKLYYVKTDVKRLLFSINGFSSSEPISFLGIKWSIQIYSKYFFDDNKKYFQFYLNAKNEIDDLNNVKWECSTSFELILKNNLPGKEDKVCQYSFTFTKHGGFGGPKFASEDELINLKNGYLKDDSIRLEVNLKVHSMKRMVI